MLSRYQTKDAHRSLILGPSHSTSRRVQDVRHLQQGEEVGVTTCCRDLHPVTLYKLTLQKMLCLSFSLHTVLEPCPSATLFVKPCFFCFLVGFVAKSVSHPCFYLKLHEAQTNSNVPKLTKSMRTKFASFQLSTMFSVLCLGIF